MNKEEKKKFKQTIQEKKILPDIKTQQETKIVKTFWC